DEGGHSDRADGGAIARGARTIAGVRTDGAATQARHLGHIKRWSRGSGHPIMPLRWKLKEGNRLISVHTDNSAERERAKAIFEEAGAEDISYTEETSFFDTPATTESR